MSDLSHRVMTRHLAAASKPPFAATALQGLADAMRVVEAMQDLVTKAKAALPAAQKEEGLQEGEAHSQHFRPLWDAWFKRQDELRDIEDVLDGALLDAGSGSALYNAVNPALHGIYQLRKPGIKAKTDPVTVWDHSRSLGGIARAYRAEAVQDWVAAAGKLCAESLRDIKAATSKARRMV